MSILLKAGEQWNPLDQIPAEQEYIPETWTGPHVGLRLVEGFECLSRMPPETVRRRLGYWPEYLYDYIDGVAQQDADQQVKDQMAAQRNRIRVRPSAQQISRMNRAITWAGSYVRIADHARLVQRVAQLRARDLDIEVISRRLRMNLRIMRNINRNCLDLIARGLRRDHVQVF
jgi:hypothetical protein